jgi:hypothetical protein
MSAPRPPERSTEVWDDLRKRRRERELVRTAKPELSSASAPNGTGGRSTWTAETVGNAAEAYALRAQRDVVVCRGFG